MTILICEDELGFEFILNRLWQTARKPARLLASLSVGSNGLREQSWMSGLDKQPVAVSLAVSLTGDLVCHSASLWNVWNTWKV